MAISLDNPFLISLWAYFLFNFRSFFPPVADFLASDPIQQINAMMLSLPPSPLGNFLSFADVTHKSATDTKHV